MKPGVSLKSSQSWANLLLFFLVDPCSARLRRRRDIMIAAAARSASSSEEDEDESEEVVDEESPDELVDEEDDEYVYLALGVRGEFEREFNNYLNLRYLLWAEFENTAEPGKKEAVYCYTYWGN